MGADAAARALVVRLGALGDLLLLRSALASLRAGGAAVTLLAPTRPGSAVVNAEDAALAQRLVPWESAELARALAAAEAGDGGEDLRRILGTFDCIVCYSRDAALARHLGRLTDRLIVHDPAPTAGHASDWLAQPLAALGAPIIAAPAVRSTTEETRAVALAREQLPPQFLVLHPGSGAQRKNWPAARYAELARRLSGGQPWLLSLGPADEALSPLTREPNVVVSRDLPPRALGALLAGAGTYVGNDSGVSHLAAAWGTRTVALFGPTDPAVWSPVGPRVRTLRAADQKMESITVDEVEAATT